VTFEREENAATVIALSDSSSSSSSQDERVDEEEEEEKKEGKFFLQHLYPICRSKFDHYRVKPYIYPGFASHAGERDAIDSGMI
jgi:hypothetical protein